MRTLTYEKTTNLGKLTTELSQKIQSLKPNYNPDIGDIAVFAVSGKEGLTTINLYTYVSDLDINAINETVLSHQVAENKVKPFYNAQVLMDSLRSDSLYITAIGLVEAQVDEAPALSLWLSVVQSSMLTAISSPGFFEEIKNQNDFNFAISRLVAVIEKYLHPEQKSAFYAKLESAGFPY